MARCKVVGWKLASLSPYVASVRYRAMLPILHLEERGIAAKIFSIPISRNIDDLDCLIIVKSFTPDDFFLACEANRRGIPVILDLCDNIFIDGYGKKSGVRSSTPALHFAQIVRFASAVVVTTNPLADIVRSRVGEQCEVVVIPDGIETDIQLARMGSKLRAAADAEKESFLHRPRRKLVSFRRKLDMLRTAEFIPYFAHAVRLAIKSAKARAKHSINVSRLSECSSVCVAASAMVGSDESGCFNDARTIRHILWFGHHGADYAQFGILDLLLIKDDLEAVAAEFDVELVVVSNNREKYEVSIKPFAMRTRYVEWSSATVLSELQNAAVTVIPNSLDDFSLCKSPNRAVLSLLNGVPVVATQTPALDDLASCLMLDNFRESLRIYLTDAGRVAADVERSRSLIGSLYGPQVIGDRWYKLIQSVHVPKPPHIVSPQLAVVVQMSLDWALLRPVVAEAVARGVGVLALVNPSLQKDSVVISGELAEMGAGVILVGYESAQDFIFPQTIMALLSASESSLLPHRLSHILTKRANASGVFTSTLQHGYETPGLTYHDALHSARKIFFASRRIYLWSDTSTLRPEVSRSTAAKCLMVGCPDIFPRMEHRVRSDRAGGNLSVGIFENLHWHRYSKDYRGFFVEGIVALAGAFPDIRFLLRTHPAGRWLKGREGQALSGIRNLVLLDPEESTDYGDGICHMFPKLDGIISTPSSVVVHAARCGLPVAVVAGDVNVARYMPLFSISTRQDWFCYVELLRSAEYSGELRLKSCQFLNAAIYPGDAATRIVDDLYRNF